MWTLCQKWFSLPGPIDSSINKLILCQKFTGFAFAEACFWGLSDVHECLGIHWLRPFGLHKQLPCWKSQSAMEHHQFRSFHLENCCALPFHGSSPPWHISACSVDKNFLKWQEMQLAVHCKVGGLRIAMCRFMVNCNAAASGLLEILQLNYVFSKHLYICV